MGRSEPHLIYGSLGQPEFIPQTAFRSVQVFLQGRRTWMVQSYSPGCANVLQCDTCFIGLSWVYNPNVISISSANFAHLMAECRWACPCKSFSLKIAPLHGAIWSHMVPFAHPSPNLKQHLSHFCTAHCRVFLYFRMGRPFSLKIASSHRGSGPPSNTWLLDHTRILMPNGISIGWAVFARLTTVTDWQTTLLSR